jgi:XTP/dITP diphosphohydrolase
MSKIKLSSLIFVSRNKNKHREYCDILGITDLKMSEMSIIESQDVSLHACVREKIEELKPKLPSIPFFVEHTGLIIDAWRGLPGGLTGIFMATVGNEGICKMMRAYEGPERVARARVVLGFFYPDAGIVTFQGEVTGAIASEPRGELNFGWDPIFIPEGDKRTYGEMTLEEKNKTSMRRRVAERFADYLADHFQL